MCRIAIYSSINTHQYYKEFIKSFVMASINDVILNKFRYGRKAHNHGWGLASIIKRYGELSHFYYRTSLPLIESDFKKILRKLHFNDIDWITLILHSRLTNNEQINVLNSQPFYINIPGKLNLWFAHNGSINKQKLAKELGMDNIKNRYSDSFFLAHWISKNIEELTDDNIKNIFKRLVEMNITKTALNVILILFDELSMVVKAVAFNYVVDVDRMNYYNLYSIKYDEKTLIVASSTIVYYMKRYCAIDPKPLNNGELLIITLTDNNIDLKNFVLI